MGRLSLASLGGPQVHHAGQTVTFPTRKALALLIYLAVEGGTHSREKISAFFWPEADLKQGRTVLRKTLARLREALEDPFPHLAGVPKSGRRDGRSHLIVEGDTLGFNFASDFDLDLHVLQTSWNLARTWVRPTPSAPEPPHPPLAQLQAAVDLYRGDFLAGFSLPDASDFDDWASLQREVWHGRMNPIFDRLSQWQTERGDIGSALDTARRWVAHHPLNEATYRRLMQLNLAEGDRTAALQAYDACRSMLAKELNAKPAPETEALARRIQTQTLPDHVERLPTADMALETSQPLKVPFIGRGNEHARLAGAYHAAHRGLTQIITVEGEPGIGKTRLAQEFLSWAAAQGADILQGRAFETGGRLPYQPLVEALRDRLERENAPDDLLADVWLAELSRLLPELRDRYPDLPRPPASQAEEAARTRLFEAVARLGQALAERGPVVLFIDDIHWADLASLDLVNYAARRWTAANVSLLLVFTLRSEELATNPLLADWLANLGRELALIRVILGPLSVEETLRLLRVLAEETRDEGSLRPTQDKGLVEKRSPAPPGGDAPGDPPTEGLSRPLYRRAASGTGRLRPAVEMFGQQLFAETGGQPFFIVETIKSLFEIHGSFIVEHYDVMPIPPSVRELIRVRLAHLGPDTLRAYTAGAVLGDGFDFVHLCQVAGLDESQGLSAVDELLGRGLLRASGGLCFFGHDKIREVVYAEAGEFRRPVLHRRALEVLEAAAPPAELARHALAAGLSERAFDLSVSAGDEAMRLFAMHDAISYYEQARTLTAGNSSARLRTDQGDVSNPQAWSHLYTQLGRAYELTHQWDKAHAIYQAMLTQAQQMRRPEIECAALNHLATLAFQDNLNLKIASVLLQQARHLAEESGDKAGLAETEWNLALVSNYTGDHERGLLHGERALVLARELGSSELTARSLNQMAYAKLWQGEWEQAEAQAREAHSLYAALDNQAMEIDCLTLMSEAQILLGQPRAGLTTARMAHALSLEIENVWGQAHSSGKIGLALLEIGEYSEALHIAQASVAAARATEASILIIFNLIHLGAIYRSLFALDAARDTHREALALNEDLGIRFFSNIIAAELCADYVLAGAWSEAYAHARQALATGHYGLIYTGLTRWLITETLLQAGDTELAAEDIRGFAEFAGNNPRYRIPYLRSLAVLARSQGNAGQAMAHLEEANTLAAEIGLPGEQWPILAALGELYQLRGEVARAHDGFERVMEIIQALAAKIDDESLRAGFLSRATQALSSGDGG